jgi:hypothetical protein
LHAHIFLKYADLSGIDVTCKIQGLTTENRTGKATYIQVALERIGGRGRFARAVPGCGIGTSWRSQMPTEIRNPEVEVDREAARLQIGQGRKLVTHRKREIDHFL